MGARNDPDTDLSSKLQKARRLIEDSISPKSPSAYSINGKTFEFEAPLLSKLNVGSYVVLDTPGGAQYLGQILGIDISQLDGPEFGLSLTADASILLASSKSSSHLQDRLRSRFLRGIGRILKRITTTS